MVQQENLSAFVMDLSWISDFTMEYEYLAMYNNEPMRIDTIIHIKNYSNYELYIHAIYSLTHLLSSKLPLYDIDKMIKRALNKIITYKFNKQKINKNNQKLKIPTYIDALFENKCAMITNIDIDCRQILNTKNKNNDKNNGCYNIFKSLLVSETNDWIKIDLFINLFPNLISITIRCFEHLIVNASSIQNLLSTNVIKSKIIKSKTQFRIEYNSPNQSELSVNDIVSKYYKSFKKSNYELLNVNDSIIIRKGITKNRRNHIKKRASKRKKRHSQNLDVPSDADDHHNGNSSGESGDESDNDTINDKNSNQDDADCIIQ